MEEVMTMSNEIQHHGIKGQKWGVRRFQNDDGSLTAAGRKRYGEDRYKTYDDGRIEIEKGAELQRILDGVISKKGLEGQTYASIGKNDNNQYMNILAKEKVSTVLKLTAKTALKSPSTNDAANMYFDILKKDKAALDEFKLMKSFAEESGFVDNFDAKLNKVINNKASEKELKEMYTYANYLFVYDDKISKSKNAFYRELNNKGFNMLRDEYDSRSGVVNAPIILLDGKASVSIKSTTLVKKSMTKDAAKYVSAYEKKGEEWAKKRYGIV